MQKAAEDLKKKQEAEAAEKKAAVEARVGKLGIEGMGPGMLCSASMFLPFLGHFVCTVR